MKVRDSDEPQCTTELITWLQFCRDEVVAGRPLKPDPWYPRSDLLTEDVVTAVLQMVEDNFTHELKVAVSYHAQQQGQPAETLRAPRFLKLPEAQRFAIVQGIDRVCQAYRMTDEEVAEWERKNWALLEVERERLAERAANLERDPHFYDYENAELYG